MSPGHTAHVLRQAGSKEQSFIIPSLDSVQAWAGITVDGERSLTVIQVDIRKLAPRIPRVVSFVRLHPVFLSWERNWSRGLWRSLLQVSLDLWSPLWGRAFRGRERGGLALLQVRSASPQYPFPFFSAPQHFQDSWLPTNLPMQWQGREVGSTPWNPPSTFRTPAMCWIQVRCKRLGPECS